MQVSFLAAHPYLLANLIGGSVLALLIWRSTDRRTVVAAGLVLVPFFPLALLHQTGYWAPARLGGLPLGIEDASYLFISGAAGWAVAGLMHPLPSVARAPVRRVLRRLAVLSLAGFATLAGAMACGLMLIRRA